ncbi:hypothetical protein [Nitrospirillum pindoramense]|nr:hypothetical protein [Nitrospirillum amazonense]
MDWPWRLAFLPLGSGAWTKIVMVLQDFCRQAPGGVSITPFTDAAGDNERRDGEAIPEFWRLTLVVEGWRFWR